MPLNFQTKSENHRSPVLAIVLFVISLVLFFAYGVEGAGGPLHAIQGAASVVASPFQSVGYQVETGVQNVSTAAADASADESSLSALREQNEALRKQVAELEEYRQEALRLESLLMVKSSVGVDGISASVIGKSGEAYSQSITISAGSNDGVDIGQTVMGSTGVVGQVIATTDKQATVRLLTDPQSGAAAIVQSSRAEGIVHGSLDGLLYLEDLDADAKVAVGDVVLTSGQGGSYVSGLIIGTVVRIDNAQDVSSRRIVVSPNDSVSGLQNVIVISSDSATPQQEGGDE